jgi:hypothetical protein
MARSAMTLALATLPERVSVVEIKIENIEEKIDELKADVKEMHDCLDNTRDLLADKLEKMQAEYRINSSIFVEHADKLHLEDQEAHSTLAGKVSELEKLKNKWQQYVMILLAFGAGTGWIGQLNLPHLLKFLGL